MAIKKRPLSARQKMINLMYVVLMAMLALNISTEVLNGFSIVEESLKRTTASSSLQNKEIYGSFEEMMEKNPTKVREWFEKATMVKNMSDSLYNFAQELKIEIVRKADGKDGNLNNIENKDNLEAAGEVLLAPGTHKGRKLYDAINDPLQKKIIAANLSTQVPKSSNATLGKNWQEAMFENMPVAAAVTLLSKLQSDVRYAEGEVLHSLISNVGLKDIRVNKLSAFVIPEKTTLYPGERFNANIVMAAVDTTQQPIIYVNGQRVNSPTGQYAFTAGGVGEHQFSGYILMRNTAGEMLRRDFVQKYTVIPAPNTATVAADMMNVLYAGYSNPISVSVPGVPANAVSVSMTGGSLKSTGNGHFVAVPAAVGKDVTFHVTARDKGQVRTMPPFTFHVRKLPDPTAYIAVGTNRFRGGVLSNDIAFRVTGFETVFFDNMGNAVPINSNGSQFSEAQLNQFRKMSRNRRFYINKVHAIGPDGISRVLPGSMEVIVR